MWKKFIIILVLTIGSSVSALAQGADEVAALERQFVQLVGQGKYAEATPIPKRAVALGEHVYGPDHPAYAALLSELAMVYQAQGRTKEAEPLQLRAAAIMKKALGCGSASANDPAPAGQQHPQIRRGRARPSSTNLSNHRS